MSALGGTTWMLGGLLAVVLAGGLFGPRQSLGQDVDSTLRRQALEDVHGPDREGKDGPLAKVGFDLALLYREWQADRQQDEAGDFAPSESSLPVREGRVTIDATAVRDAAALQQELEELGLEDGAHAGRLVSGRLPIAAIPDAARLASLRAMRPARAMTRSGPRPAAPETTAVDGDASSDATVWYVAGAAMVVVGGLLFWGLQR